MEKQYRLKSTICNLLEEDLTLSATSPCVGTGEDGSNMGAFGVGYLLPR